MGHKVWYFIKRAMDYFILFSCGFHWSVYVMQLLFSTCSWTFQIILSLPLLIELLGRRINRIYISWRIYIFWYWLSLNRGMILNSASNASFNIIPLFNSSQYQNMYISTRYISSIYTQFIAQATNIGTILNRSISKLIYTMVYTAHAPQTYFARSCRLLHDSSLSLACMQAYSFFSWT